MLVCVCLNTVRGAALLASTAKQVRGEVGVSGDQEYFFLYSIAAQW